MKWREFLEAEVENTYSVTAALVALVTDDTLGWKPPSGSNWMTTGQLLKHLAEGCAPGFRAFILGDWGLPEGKDISDLAGAPLPVAEAMPGVASVAEVVRLLREDRQATLECLLGVSEERLETEPAPAPWDSSRMVLGRRLLQMVDHQKQHKGQLFYYLKLQGKPVATPQLWGA